MLSEVEGAHPDAEIVFGPAVYAQSGGTAAQAVMDLFTARLDETLREHADVDAILLSFHGAPRPTSGLFRSSGCLGPSTRVDADFAPAASIQRD